MNKRQFNAVVKWQNETFPQSTSLAKFDHLAEEMKELKEELKKRDPANLKKELADCFILMFGIADSEGLDWIQLLRAIDSKMRANKKRKWGIPEPNGVVHHLK